MSETTLSNKIQPKKKFFKKHLFFFLATAAPPFFSIPGCGVAEKRKKMFHDRKKDFPSTLPAADSDYSDSGDDEPFWGPKAIAARAAKAAAQQCNATTFLALEEMNEKLFEQSSLDTQRCYSLGTTPKKELVSELHLLPRKNHSFSSKSRIFFSSLLRQNLDGSLQLRMPPHQEQLATRNQGEFPV
jgi:hypothetical protein